MATKIRSKGCSLLMSISAVYTAIPMLKSFTISGASSQTYNASTLDQTGAYELNEPSGYTTAPSIGAEGFRDPDDAVQMAFIALMVTPVATNFKTTYTDTTPLSEVYSGTGFGFDTTVQMSEGVGCTYNIQTSGNPA
jgi:hypothetical protein